MVQASRIAFFLLGLGLAASAWAGGPVNWTFSSETTGADTVQVRLSATCDTGWHIYALTLPSDEGPLPTVVHTDPSAAFHLAGPVEETAPEEKEDPAFGMLVRFHSGIATFMQAVVPAKPEAFTIHGSVEYMACNDKTCLPPTTVEFTLDIPPSR